MGGMHLARYPTVSCTSSRLWKNKKHTYTTGRCHPLSHSFQNDRLRLSTKLTRVWTKVCAVDSPGHWSGEILAATDHRDLVLERPNGVKQWRLSRYAIDHYYTNYTLYCIVVIDGISTKSSLFYPVRAFQVPMAICHWQAVFLLSLYVADIYTLPCLLGRLNWYIPRRLIITSLVYSNVHYTSQRRDDSSYDAKPALV